MFENAEHSDYAIKKSFLDAFLLWSRKFIDEVSLSLLDFIDWLISSSRRGLFDFLLFWVVWCLCTLIMPFLLGVFNLYTRICAWLKDLYSSFLFKCTEMVVSDLKMISDLPKLCNLNYAQCKCGIFYKNKKLTLNVGLWF